MNNTHFALKNTCLSVDVSSLNIYLCNKENTDSILSRNEATTILFVIVVVLIPTMATFGVIGNMLSMATLIKDGVQKSYNIMLIALACSDSSFLIPLICHGFVGAAGFRMPRHKTAVTFIAFKILMIMDYTGGMVSLLLPLLITTERLIAVFFPLSMSRIITSRKTFCIICAVFLTIFCIVLYLTIEESLAADLNRGNDTTSDGLIDLAIFRNSVDSSSFMQQYATILMGPAPILYVFVGCLVLSVKIKLATMKRSAMTNAAPKGSSTFRITAMLLVVCFVYAVTSSVTFFLHSGVFTHLYATRDYNGMVAMIIGEFNNIMVVINCSCNFLIYVMMNKKFRDTFVEMMTGCCIGSKR